MARTLRVLLNIGLDHVKQYGLPEASENDVITVEDDVANVMVNTLQCAEDYDAAKEQQRLERAQKFDEAAIERDIAEREKREQIEKQVLERRAAMKAGKKPQVKDATQPAKVS